MPAVLFRSGGPNFSVTCSIVVSAPMKRNDSTLLATVEWRGVVQPATSKKRQIQSRGVIQARKMPNVRAQAGRGERAQHATETESRPCLKHGCSALSQRLFL